MWRRFCSEFLFLHLYIYFGEMIVQMRCSTHQGLRLSKADSTDGIHSVCSMVEIWIPVLGRQTTTDAGLRDFRGRSERDMTLQADFAVKPFLAGCADAPHICQINHSHCKIQIIQPTNLFVMRWHICWLAYSYEIVMYFKGFVRHVVFICFCVFQAFVPSSQYSLC